MSWKAEVIADSSGKFVSNSLRFATKVEAQRYAEDLAYRWTLVRQHRVIETTGDVTHAIVNGTLVAL
jgi:hypothetical protein